MKFVDPKNDVAFRKIFGDEKKKHLLVSFLNHVLGFTGTEREITGITLPNPYQVPQLKRLKESILDVKALDKRGIHYIVEMQVFQTEAFKKRVLYYVSKAYVHQLGRGHDYPRLNQVIFLGFLDFRLFKEVSSYDTRHLMLEEKSNGHYFKDFEMNFVELPKFEVPLEHLSDVKEKWIYFLKHAGDMTEIPPQLREPPELKEAFEAANRMSWTPEEFDAYIDRGIVIEDERGRFAFALKKGFKQGEESGFKKGEESGFQKGEESGFKKGEESGFKKGVDDNKLAIARTMLNEGFAPEDIVRVSGISPERISPA